MTLTTAILIEGYVVALDQSGNQMPEYQGPYTEVKEKIEREGVEIRRSLACLKGGLLKCDKLNT